MDGIFEEVVEVVFLYYERFDGFGYFFKFKGDKIFLFVRIVVVVDVYDVFIVDRVYKKKIVLIKVVDYFIKYVGIYFDKDIV